MANNFFLSQDPLLFQQGYQNPQMVYDNADLQKQMNETMAQYKLYQQNHNNNNMNMNQDLTDYVGDLDKLLHGLTESTIQELNSNDEYVRLNKDLNDIIQTELMENIRWKINSNNNAVQNIKRQKEIIDTINKNIEEEQRRNMNELNDYMKNYSHLTFDEYKRIKNGETLNNKKSTKIVNEI